MVDDVYYKVFVEEGGYAYKFGFRMKIINVGHSVFLNFSSVKH